MGATEDCDCVPPGSLPRRIAGDYATAVQADRRGTSGQRGGAIGNPKVAKTELFIIARYGRGKAPSWLTTLVLAEKWHKTPEEILTMRGGLKWAARQAAWDEAQATARKMDK